MTSGAPTAGAKASRALNAEPVCRMSLSPVGIRSALRAKATWPSPGRRVSRRGRERSKARCRAVPRCRIDYRHQRMRRVQALAGRCGRRLRRLRPVSEGLLRESFHHQRRGPLPAQAQPGTVAERGRLDVQHRGPVVGADPAAGQQDAAAGVRQVKPGAAFRQLAVGQEASWPTRHGCRARCGGRCAR